MEIEVLAIDILEEPIELCKLLKIANLVGGGGEAKMLISQGYVYLNGEVELQKRKKIYCNDIVQFNGEAIMPVLAEPVERQEEEDMFIEPVSKSPTMPNHNKKNSQNNALRDQQSKQVSKKQKSKNKTNNSNTDKNSKTGRKSISF